MIKTERLLIRQFKQSDYEDLYEYLSLPEIYEYEPGEPINMDMAKEIAKQRSFGNDFYAVELSEINKVIGHIYFKQIEPMEWMTWEIGYIFNPNYQRKGYATEAVKAIVEYAFGNLGTHRIVAHCNPKNEASWKLLDRIGMRREGTLIKNVFFKKDEAGKPIWQDTYEYAMLNETDV